MEQFKQHIRNSAITTTEQLSRIVQQDSAFCLQLFTAEALAKGVELMIYRILKNFEVFSTLLIHIT